MPPGPKIQLGSVLSTILASVGTSLQEHAPKTAGSFAKVSYRMDPMYSARMSQLCTSKPFGSIRFNIFHLPMSYLITWLWESIQVTPSTIWFWMDRVGWHCEFDSDSGINSYIWVLWSVIVHSFLWMNGFKFLLGLGVSLSWLGFVPSNFSLTPSSGIYSIDGQTPIYFFVPALGAANANASALSLYNQVLFKTETLSPGQHTLKVTYQGNSGTAPFALDAFIVQNATSPSTTSSSVPSSTSNLSSKKYSLVGIIVGVVGGVIVLVLLLLLYIHRRNSRRARKLEEKLNTNPEPFTSSPRNSTSEVPPLTPQPFSSKFSRRRHTANGPGSSRPTSPPVIRAGINPIPAIRNIPLMQPSTSTQGGDLGFLQHADSGVRMSHAEDNLDELPPVYTSGWCHLFF